MVMFDLIKLLAESDVEFVLVGGLAVALHGYPRMTMDVDVVLAMDDKNLRRFIDAAKAAGLQPTIPVPIEALAQPELIEQWHREKGMLAFSLRSPEAQATVIDILVRPVVPYAALRDAAVLIDTGPYRIPVASIDHLIAKKNRHRARQGRHRHRSADETAQRSIGMTGKENLRLIREIEANRAFLLATYGQNPSLLANTEPRIRELFEALPTIGPAAAFPKKGQAQV